MISPALILSWMWGKKRQPMPEYQSPNSWADYTMKNYEALGFLDDLVSTFTPVQMKKYQHYRAKVREAEMAKPWQGNYAKNNPLEDTI